MKGFTICMTAKKRNIWLRFCNSYDGAWLLTRPFLLFLILSILNLISCLLTTLSIPNLTSLFSYHPQSTQKKYLSFVLYPHLSLTHNKKFLILCVLQPPAKPQGLIFILIRWLYSKRWCVVLSNCFFLLFWVIVWKTKLM